MIMGLLKGQEKQSKSIKGSAIFMQDTEEEVNLKISEAFCPPTVDKNPVLNLMKLIVFEKYSSITIKRLPQHGGDLVYNSYKELEEDYGFGKVHPQDLKTTVARYVNEMIQPVREHFERDPYAKELLDKVKSYQVTR
jgi:tyrosyl-tRNA synthetase